METKVEEQPTIVDTAKLALSIVIVLGGLVAYYYFGDSSTLLRTLGVLLALALAAVVALTSLQGRALWKFVQTLYATLPPAGAISARLIDGWFSQPGGPPRHG